MKKFLKDYRNRYSCFICVDPYHSLCFSGKDHENRQTADQ